MAATAEMIKKLREPMPCKWKPQVAKEYGCQLVAYIDARQAIDALDNCVGPENWQRDYKKVGDVVYCGVGILTTVGWVWKWDAGTESDMDAEKGESSDAFKRACVSWGLGRFLYELPIVKTKSIKDNRGKFQPADESGQRIWDCTDYCNRKNQAKAQTQKPAYAPAPAKAATAPLASVIDIAGIRSASTNAGMDSAQLMGLITLKWGEGATLNSLNAEQGIYLKNWLIKAAEKGIPKETLKQLNQMKLAAASA